jgi:hypothetical protein
MGSGLHVCMVTASLVQLVLQGRSRPRPSPRHDYVARLACFKPHNSNESDESRFDLSSVAHL